MAEPKVSRTRLVLVRHGEALSNIEPIVGGPRGDEGLTPLGIRQAEALRDRLRDRREFVPDVLISSTLARARQTAEIIAPALGDLPIAFEDDVQEMRVGDADGMHVADFKATYGLPDFRRNPFQPIAPGGESWASFVLRAGATLHRITREHEGQTIVVVCHGGIIDASFVTFMQLPSLQLPPVEFLTINTSITEWQREIRDGEPGRWRLRRYNDVEHLASLPRNRPIDWRAVTPREHSASPSPAEAESEDGES
jgi:probable phosphoglycerate mutase